jgi:hypothetical protein
MGTTKTKTKAEAAPKKAQVEAVGMPQQEPMTARPQREHEWLQRLVGEWTCEGEMTMKPDEPPVKYEGTESVRSLGDLWILAEGRGEMPGCGSSTTMMTLGYNPQKERFVGTFIGSMMTHMWIYDGALDADEKVLTLDTEGPSMAAEGEMARFKDVMEIKSDDHRILTSHILGDDGQWHQFMTAHYRRRR